MGAGVLRKKIQDAGLSQISVLTARSTTCRQMWTWSSLTVTDRTRYAPGSAGTAYFADQLLDSGLYTSLTERLVAAQRHTQTKRK